MTNAWRHADGAGQAVSVERRDGRLRIEVRDRGQGFDPAALDGGRERLGLLGMRERAESLGGEFRIEGAPGEGTAVVAVLPLQPSGDWDA
ncbi:MAG: ATP-binding protein [Chloroflexota bacterium]|nr:ATP-binding protein [Chloroflexota bacterium]